MASTISTVTVNPTESLRLVVKVPMGFRFRIGLAVSLVRLAAFVGGMGFRAELDTEANDRIEAARQDIKDGARPRSGRFEL